MGCLGLSKRLQKPVEIYTLARENESQLTRTRYPADEKIFRPICKEI
jgi:hypothetical protein